MPQWWPGMTRLRSLLIAAAVAVLAVGCGSAPRPEAQIASSEGAIRGASEAGAQSVPQATLHLKLAQEQREAALKLIADGENERGRLMLARSEADAELAIALARQASAEKRASEAKAKVESLEEKVSQ